MWAAGAFGCTSLPATGARFVGEASARKGLDSSATAATVVDAEADAAAATAGASVGRGAASGETATGASAEPLGSGTPCVGGIGATVCSGTGVRTASDSGGDGSALGATFTDCL